MLSEHMIYTYSSACNSGQSGGAFSSWYDSKNSTIVVSIESISRSPFKGSPLSDSFRNGLNNWKENSLLQLHHQYLNDKIDNKSKSRVATLFA